MQLSLKIWCSVRAQSCIMRGERNQFWDDNVIRWQVLGSQSWHTGKLQSYLVFRFLQSHDGNDCLAYNRCFRPTSIQLWIEALAAGSFRSQKSSHLRVWPAIGRPRHCLTFIGRESGTNSKLLDSNKQRDSQAGSRCVFLPQQPTVSCIFHSRLCSCVIITAQRNPSPEECAMCKVWSHPNYPIIRDWVSVGTGNKRGERELTNSYQWSWEKWQVTQLGIWTFLKPSPFFRVISADCVSISGTHESTFI